MQEGNPIDGVLRNGFTGTLFGCLGMVSVDDQLGASIVGDHVHQCSVAIFLVRSWRMSGVQDALSNKSCWSRRCEYSNSSMKDGFGVLEGVLVPKSPTSNGDPMCETEG
jgi:hypothetical protein